MNKHRMEAFSDGVIAILMTIMVFDLKPPAGKDSAALWGIAPLLLSYLMSFLYLGIYWSNHHHMLALVKRVNGRALWANLHLLFWLSLLPFATHWMRVSEFEHVATALYGIVLLCSALGYLFLQATLIRLEGEGSRLKAAIGNDIRGKASVGLYVLGIALASFSSRLAIVVYVLVALLWLIPDRRIESQFQVEQE